jgi:hypothetical protein
VCAIRSKPLALIGDAYFYLGKSSWIMMMLETLIALRGSGDRALKADWSLTDPIVKLKADCPEI